MVELNHKVKEALIKMNFVKRYEELSVKYNKERTPVKERLVYLDGEEIMETIKQLGYIPLFDSKEKFYYISEEIVDNLKFGFNIILRDSSADLVWIVKENEELILGLPWSVYSRLLINSDYRIMPPFFGSYDDIDEILKTAFQMYEDFKKAITTISK